MSALSPQEALKMYEEATNSNEFKRVARLISDDAVYYFSDETVKGLDSLQHYFEKTWNYIQEEEYQIHDVEWVAMGADIAVCSYHFHWAGKIEGIQTEGKGRGTNVFRKEGQGWKVIHEHLSTQS